MGKHRREKALGFTFEQRIAERKLHPDGVFKNGSGQQLKLEKRLKSYARQQRRLDAMLFRSITV